MQRKTLHLALDFFLLGAAIPLILLVLWQLSFAHAGIVAQDRFLQIAMALWPAGMQMMFVPHGESWFGHALAIFIMIVQNAILYSIIALVVHWLVARIRHQRIPQAH
jgi:hypothetical protein